MIKVYSIISLTILSIFYGCAYNTEHILDLNKSQVQTRSYQARVYDTSDKELVMRSVISTMQDLGFIINQADNTLGIISGQSFANQSVLTVTVRSEKNNTIVRVNAQHNLKSIDDPLAYQNFFSSLSKSLFLEGSEIE